MGVVQDILRTMDYGPSPEGSEHVKAWLKEHEKGFGHFINGAFTKPGNLFDVSNPATGERIARVSQGSPKDVDAAVAAARKAQAKWAALSGFERSKHIYALARHVQKRERFLSVLETIDNGKPIRESRDIEDFTTAQYSALDMLAQQTGRPVTQHQAAEVVRRMESLPSHPEVAGALARLRHTPLQVAALTNSVGLSRRRSWSTLVFASSLISLSRLIRSAIEAGAATVSDSRG